MSQKDMMEKTETVFIESLVNNSSGSRPNIEIRNI